MINYAFLCSMHHRLKCKCRKESQIDQIEYILLGKRWIFNAFPQHATAIQSNFFVIVAVSKKSLAELTCTSRNNYLRQKFNLLERCNKIAINMWHEIVNIYFNTITKKETMRSITIR